MIKVIGSRCLVEIDLKCKETDSGIKLIHENEHTEYKGKVVSVGDAGPVVVGDHILIEQFAGTPVDDVDYDCLLMIVDYDDILAIVS